MILRETRGTPFERGKQHGAAHAVSARALYARFCERLRLDDPDVGQRVRLVEGNMRRVCPEVLDEISGISDGTGLSYEQVLLLNCSVDLGAIDHLAQCTNVIFADTPHGILHAENHDIEPSNAARLVVGEHAHLPNGVLVKRVMWAGTTWGTIGVNSLGLSFGESTVWVKDTNWETGIPINVLAGLPLMRCGTVSEVVSLLEEAAPINYGYNFACTDTSGDAAIIERSPTRCAVRRLAGRALWCTDHFHEPEMLEVQADTPEIVANSLDRWSNLARIAADPDWFWDLDGLQATMRDHTDPGAICRHNGPHDSASCTTRSCIMVPAWRQLLLADGYPCLHPYLPSQAWLE